MSADPSSHIESAQIPEDKNKTSNTNEANKRALNESVKLCWGKIKGRKR